MSSPTVSGVGLLQPGAEPLLHLTGFCFLAVWKEGLYPEPPPTPPGYLGILITDFEVPPNPALRPPEYTVALQSSCMVVRPAEVSSLAPGGRPQWHKPSEADPHLAPCQDQGFCKEEDGRCGRWQWGSAGPGWALLGRFCLVGKLPEQGRP